VGLALAGAPAGALIALGDVRLTNKANATNAKAQAAGNPDGPVGLCQVSLHLGPKSPADASRRRRGPLGPRVSRP